MVAWFISMRVGMDPHRLEPSFATSEIDATIPCNPKQPGAECPSTWLKGVRSLYYTHEGVVYQILCSCRTPIVPTEDEELLGISSIQLVQRFRLACFELVHELFVAEHLESSPSDRWQS